MLRSCNLSSPGGASTKLLSADAQIGDAVADPIWKLALLRRDQRGWRNSDQSVLKLLTEPVRAYRVVWTVRWGTTGIQPFRSLGGSKRCEQALV
jgi:hypothetical protein